MLFRPAIGLENKTAQPVRNSNFRQDREERKRKVRKTTSSLQRMRIINIALLLVVVVVTALAPLVRGQSRCVNACKNSPTCATGLCTLQSCTDSGTCYEYCLNCAGVVTCYASGYGCSFNSAPTVQFYSFGLLAAVATVAYFVF